MIHRPMIHMLLAPSPPLLLFLPLLLPFSSLHPPLRHPRLASFLSPRVTRFLYPCVYVRQTASASWHFHPTPSSHSFFPFSSPFFLSLLFSFLISLFPDGLDWRKRKRKSSAGAPRTHYEVSDALSPAPVNTNNMAQTRQVFFCSSSKCHACH